MNILLVLFATIGVCAAQIQEISGERIRANVRFLASDQFEGRGVGTRGDRLTTEYLATQFALIGAKPAGENGTYFQRVPLVGVETGLRVELTASAQGQTASFRWLDDFVGASQRQKALDELDAEAVFVGHGIIASEFRWDDFKGVDVRGKVVVLFTNEPSSTDPAFFGGRALTYYGRWTYKFEQALRKGAAGAIIIHTTPTAGYGWQVVRNSWSGEEPYVRLVDGEPALSFAGWVTREAGERLLALAGKSVDQLLKLAESPAFRPVSLGIRVRGRFPTRIRELDTRNVAAMIPGGDPVLKSEYVVFSAHWDHLGMGAPENGDSIYNGAVDNATGCAMLLEMARAWADLERKPKRSALFLAVTAEEGGLRGSQYYATHPIVAPGKTAAAFNFDAFYPWGRTSDVVVRGAERTTLWPVVQDAARRMNLQIAPDPRPEQGSYYRSDHFSFAKAGIPAFSVNMGNHFLGRPDDYGEKLFEEFNAKHYHQPSDEFGEDWDYSGMVHMARFGFLLGTSTANLDKLPTWQPGDEFLAAREKSGVK